MIQITPEVNISLPHFDYICQKNTYSGSIGDFRYKIFPVKKDEIDTVLTAAVYFRNCYETEKEAGRVTEQEFAYSEAGIREAEQFLKQQYLNGTV